MTIGLGAALRFVLGTACAVATMTGCGESFMAGTGGTGGATAGSGGTTANGGTGGQQGECAPGDEDSCYTGPPGTEGIGTCAPGVKTCDASGNWGPCEGETLPADTEECDGSDDTCDGNVDETCACSDGAVQDCFPGPGEPGKGECDFGSQECVDGSWTICEGATVGKAEVCNGADDDCNGTTDDLPQIGNMCIVAGEKGICQDGKQVCDPSQGSLSCEQINEPKDEECNGIDEDCNGTIDDLPLSWCSTMVPVPNGEVVACMGVLACDALNQQICSPRTPYFADSFADANNTNWTFDAGWMHGPAAMSTGHTVGNGDPANDATNPDNRLAGATIGGNIGFTNGMVYMTSKEINVQGAQSLYLSYMRWLNTTGQPDRPHVVEVSKDNGPFTAIWTNGGDTITDSAWEYMHHDLQGLIGNKIRIRFGFAQNNAALGVVSGWNIDRVVLSACPPPAP